MFLDSAKLNVLLSNCSFRFYGCNGGLRGRELGLRAEILQDFGGVFGQFIAKKIQTNENLTTEELVETINIYFATFGLLTAQEFETFKSKLPILLELLFVGEDLIEFRKDFADCCSTLRFGILSNLKFSSTVSEKQIDCICHEFSLGKRQFC